MSITIEESGLIFGEYDEADVFHIEHTKLYKSCGGDVKSVEFALYKDANILFIEAKKSSPRKINKFISEICSEFIHSLEIYFAVILKRLHDKNHEMPANFYSLDHAEITMILVINGHKREWLAPINYALQKALKRQIRVWNLSVIAINHEQAYSYGLIIKK